MAVTLSKGVTLRKPSDRKPSAPCTFNTPCASAGRVVTPLRTIAGFPVAKLSDRPDYSDGYGGTYAAGE